MKKLTTNQVIGANIQRRRKEFGLTQEELATAVGLSRISIVNMEAGRQATIPEKLMEICSVLSCTPNDLFPPIPRSKAQLSPVHISFKSKKARQQCLSDPAFVSSMNKMITKAYYMKTKSKK